MLSCSGLSLIANRKQRMDEIKVNVPKKYFSKGCTATILPRVLNKNRNVIINKATRRLWSLHRLWKCPLLCPIIQNKNIFTANETPSNTNNWSLLSILPPHTTLREIRFSKIKVWKIRTSTICTIKKTAANRRGILEISFMFSKCINSLVQFWLTATG